MPSRFPPPSLFPTQMYFDDPSHPIRLPLVRFIRGKDEKTKMKEGKEDDDSPCSPASLDISPPF